MGNANNGTLSSQQIDQKKVPPAFLGLAFLGINFAGVFGAAWLAVSGDVREYIKSKNELRLKEIEYAHSCNVEEGSAVRKCNSECTSQLSSIRDELQADRKTIDALRLSSGVAEHENSFFRQRLESCEAQLVKIRK